MVDSSEMNKWRRIAQGYSRRKGQLIDEEVEEDNSEMKK